MGKSLSFNCGNAHNEKHNRRDFKDVPEHIDADFYKRDVVIYDRPLEQTFNDFYKDETAVYNFRQKPSRRIDNPFKHFYDAQLKARDKDADEGNKTHRYEKKVKAPVKELIIQIGSHDDAVPYDDAVAILSDYARQFESLNPAFHICQAIIHADEPDGTVHMHLNFCYKDTRERDLMKALKFEGALNAMGYDSGFSDEKDKIHSKAFNSWQKSQRDVIAEIAKSRGIEINEVQKSTRRHFDTPEFKAYEDAVKSKSTELDEVNAAIAEGAETVSLLSEAVETLQADRDNLETEVNSLTEKVMTLKGEVLDAERTERAIGSVDGFINRILKLISPDRVIIPIEDFRNLEATARHGVEVDEAFDSRKKQQDARDKQLSKRERKVKADEDAIREEPRSIYIDEEEKQIAILESLKAQVKDIQDELDYLKTIDGTVELAGLRSENDRFRNVLDEMVKELDYITSFINDKDVKDEAVKVADYLESVLSGGYGHDRNDDFEL